MSAKAGLVAAAFSAHLGIPIKTEKEAKEIEKLRTERCPICGEVGCSYISAASVTTTTLFDYSRNQIGDSDRYTVRPFGQDDVTENDVDPNSTVGDIKKAIASKGNIPSKQGVVLQYGGRKLDDSKTPQEQNVPLGSTLVSSTTYWGGDGPHPVYYIQDSDLDPEKDFDFTRFSGPSRCERGGHVYDRPVGWDRCALKVRGKYKDDIWLGEDGMRAKSTPGEWAVSFHGTAMTNVRSISGTGYDNTKSVREAFGPGIYSTPSIDVAAGYAKEFPYKMVLQNRINLQESNEISANQTGVGASYFVTPDENNVRPYGVCLKPLSDELGDTSAETGNSCLLQ